MAINPEVITTIRNIYYREGLTKAIKEAKKYNLVPKFYCPKCKKMLDTFEAVYKTFRHSVLKFQIFRMMKIMILFYDTYLQQNIVCQNTMSIVLHNIWYFYKSLLIIW